MFFSPLLATTHTKTNTNKDIWDITVSLNSLCEITLNLYYKTKMLNYKNTVLKLNFCQCFEKKSNIVLMALFHYVQILGCISNTLPSISRQTKFFYFWGFFFIESLRWPVICNLLYLNLICITHYKNTYLSKLRQFL